MRLEGAKIVVLVENEFEDIELWYPVYRLIEEGAIVHMLGAEPNKVYHGKHGVPATSDDSFEDADANAYDAIFIPGGWAPDKLRRYESVLALVKKMHDAEKVIATICHGGWVLISAGIARNRKITGTPAIKDDLNNSGAEWIGEPAIVDGNIVSAQRPPDLPNFMKLFISTLERQMGEGKA